MLDQLSILLDSLISAAAWSLLLLVKYVDWRLVLETLLVRRELNLHVLLFRSMGRDIVLIGNNLLASVCMNGVVVLEG